MRVEIIEKLETTLPSIILHSVSNNRSVVIPDNQEPEVLQELSTYTSPQGYIEGATYLISINAYERNEKARCECIAFHGITCIVCGFDFEKAYGNIGRGFIHVHHLIPLHTIGEEYIVNPQKDLVPVCPNCHAMLHRKLNDKEITIDFLKNSIKRHE